MSLVNLRRKIDKLDKDIVGLLNKRASIARDIGRLKKHAKKGVYMPDREVEIYSNILGQNKGPLTDNAIKATIIPIERSMNGSRSAVKFLIVYSISGS